MNLIILIRNFLSYHWVITLINCYIAHFIKLPIIKPKVWRYVSRFFAAVIALINSPFLGIFFKKFFTAILANHLLPLLVFIKSVGAAKKLQNNLPILRFKFNIKKKSIESIFKFVWVSIRIFCYKIIAEINFFFFKFNKSFLEEWMFKCNFKRFCSIHAPIIIQNDFLVNLNNKINYLGVKYGKTTH